MWSATFLVVCVFAYADTHDVSVGVFVCVCTICDNRDVCVCVRVCTICHNHKVGVCVCACVHNMP